MTRKHFEAIAHTLDANRANLALVCDFADMCGEFNEQFDRERFIKAATLNLRKDAETEIRILKREGIIGMAVD